MAIVTSSPDIKIASDEFPFILNENSFEEQHLFDTNEDLKISFAKKSISQNKRRSNITISVCKQDFDTLMTFFFITIDSAKNLFVISLSIAGAYKKYLCDIISNLQVSATATEYTVTFEVIIIQEV
jgi:hypothetical protein